MENLIQMVRQEHPMVHMITNHVTVNDTVNIILAAGGTAICADAPAETAEITAISDTLLLNTGTPSRDTLEAMLNAAREANRRSLPVVLDPVGAGASVFRGRILEQLLQEVQFSCIRDSDVVCECMRWYGLMAEKAQQEMEQSGHVGTAAFRGWLMDEVSQSENMA